MANLPENHLCVVCQHPIGYGEGECAPGYHGREPGTLRPARSQAELIRTRNSNILLFIACMQVTCNALVALRVFEII